MRAVLLETFAAGVGDKPKPFLQEQTVLRQTEVEPAPYLFAGDLVVIAFRIVTKQRQPKTVLPTRCAVAAAGVATSLGQDRNDIPPKAHRRIGCGLFDRHR